MSEHDVTVTVNGRRERHRVPARLSLLDFLREVCNLTGTHMGCEHGVCGACSVLFDGVPMRACLMFAAQADGHDVTTVEGLAPDRETLTVLQDSFWECHALQCGYCTSGMLIAAHALLTATHAPSDEAIRDALDGNLCRCTGYVQIVEAVRLAAERLRAKEKPGGR